MVIEPPVLSVTEINRHIRNWLEQDIGLVRVEGEISNLSKPASGHFYFTLKDAGAQLRSVYFRNRHVEASRLENGQKVVATGRLSLYEARGDYQLIVERLSDAGLGDLFQAFTERKTRLAALGLFDPARKKPIPRFPTCIGVITSTHGAALHDIVTTLARRYPCARVIVYPSDVQGQLAAPQLTHAVITANQQARCDVLILARGGGSFEDLWAFNDEALVHAIADSSIPVVSGVGHETDFTLADFVADLRAATPTAAAEAVTPDQVDLRLRIRALDMRMRHLLSQSIQQKRTRLAHLSDRIHTPGVLIARYWQRLDYLEQQMQRAMQQVILVQTHRLQVLLVQVHTHHPQRLISDTQEEVKRLKQRLEQSMKQLIQRAQQQLTAQRTTLHAVSPLATLDRGYAIVSYQDAIVSDSQQVHSGDRLMVRLAKGQLVCDVVN